jgi:hypothetical protein
MNAAQAAFVAGGGAAAVAVAVVAETILGACFPYGACADSGRERAWSGRQRPVRVPMPWHRRTQRRQSAIADRPAADTRRRAVCRTRVATATRRARSGQREAEAVAAAAGAAAGRATMPPPGRRCRSRPPLAVSSVAACVLARPQFERVPMIRGGGGIETTLGRHAVAVKFKWAIEQGSRESLVDSTIQGLPTEKTAFGARRRGRSESQRKLFCTRTHAHTHNQPVRAQP